MIKIALVCLLLYSQLAIAALTVRDLDGNASNGYEGVYDEIQDVTWLANGNLAASETFGVSGIDSLGRMDWFTAMDWVAAMNAVSHLGHAGWRLADMDINRDNVISGCLPGSIFDARCRDNEYGFLFSRGLISTSNPGSFINVQEEYWSFDSLPQRETYFANFFNFTTGQVNSLVNYQPLKHAWVVADGDIAHVVVPVPAAGWLFGFVLAGLVGLRAKRK